MINQKTASAVLLAVVSAGFVWASGVVPAIVPAAVPTANKVGNSAKFQLAATSGPVNGDCATFDANLNITGPGTGAGCAPSSSNVFTCQSGLGDGLNAITAATYLQTTCINKYPGTYTISSIQCLTNNAGSSTLSATNGAGTALLTGAITCSNTLPGVSGVQSATTTIAVDDGIKFTFISDGASLQTTWTIKGTR